MLAVALWIPQRETDQIICWIILSSTGKFGFSISQIISANFLQGLVIEKAVLKSVVSVECIV